MWVDLFTIEYHMYVHRLLKERTVDLQCCTSSSSKIQAFYHTFHQVMSPERRTYSLKKHLLYCKYSRRPEVRYLFGQEITKQCESLLGHTSINLRQATMSSPWYFWCTDTNPPLIPSLCLHLTYTVNHRCHHGIHSIAFALWNQTAGAKIGL